MGECNSWFWIAIYATLGYASVVFAFVAVVFIWAMVFYYIKAQGERKEG